MQSMRSRAVYVAAALLVLTASPHAGAQAGADGAGATPADNSPSSDIRKGERLATALAALRSQGLTLIFSSTLIGADLTVDVEPGSGSAEAVARRILASHSLTLEAIRPGMFAVVKETAASRARAAASSQTVAKAPGAAAESINEIDIYASRYEIEQQESAAALAELKREDLEALPGLDEDVLRVTRFLPGTAANAMSARSHVRGGRDDELAVFFDGVPLFEPFHYKDVQSLLGMLDPESISSLDFFSGVFPVRYGNRLSGVLDIQPRTWSGQDDNAIGASFLYTHALSQGRLDSYPLEWLVSARHGNVDLFADLFEHRETEPDFLDALGRLQLDIGERASLIGGWLLLDDELGANFENGSERGNIEYRDATGWLSWRFRASADAELRATVSRTERHTNRTGSVDQPDNSAGTVDDRRRFDTTTMRLEGTLRVNPSLIATAGFEGYDYNARYDYHSVVAFDPVVAAAFDRAPTYTQDTALHTSGEAYAAYGSTTLELAPRTSVDLSLRWDAQRFNADFHDNQLSPRVSFQHVTPAATTFRVSWGRAAQTLRPDELQVQEGDTHYPVAQRATQIAASMERRVSSFAQLRIEAYDKRVHDPSPVYENLLDPFALLPELEVDRTRIQPDRSRMYGAELSVRWQLPEKWSGWTSYTWSQATDLFGNVSVPRTWDQKHAITTGVAWTNHPWQLSTNVSWHTGWRRNELVTTDLGVELLPRNTNTWPAYFSVDSRIGWQHSLPKGMLNAFFEIENLTNHSNLCCSNYRLPAGGLPGSLARDDSSWLPRLFLLGVTWQLP
jgi:hypothetical protein